MTTDPGVLCFQHCGAKVFCFVVPETCPLCRNQILNENSSFGIMPFRLPYPFVRATQTQASVILRPTRGDFLHDYNNNTDLHIAVTTSEGSIVEFDSRGLRRHTPDVNKDSWEQCLVLESIPEAWYEYWDDTLIKVCQRPLWSPASYNQNSHNCYSFVLTFLLALGYPKLSRAATSKTIFCERFICPKTVIAGKYISLYRKIRDQGHYVHLSTTNSSKAKASCSGQTNGTVVTKKQ